MKVKLYHILPLLLFILLSSVGMAQDGTESMEPEVRSSYLPGGESQKFEAKDSMYFRPAPQARMPESQKVTNSPAVKNNEEDDGVLSFNFLYYIIQKFKMSDIVDP